MEDPVSGVLASFRQPPKVEANSSLTRMWTITKGLCLGTKEDSESAASLESAGVTHVVNCAAELPCFFEGTFQYLHLQLKDPDERFSRRLPKAMSFIDRGRESGTVLVHCSGGISRSPAVILAYLCHSGRTLFEAVGILQRAVRTRPNAVFLRQVCDYFGFALSDDELTNLLARLAADSPTKGDRERN